MLMKIKKNFSERQRDKTHHILVTRYPPCCSENGHGTTTTEILIPGLEDLATEEEVIWVAAGFNEVIPRELVRFFSTPFEFRNLIKGAERIDASDLLEHI
jgi:hypothetical protein